MIASASMTSRAGSVALRCDRRASVVDWRRILRSVVAVSCCAVAVGQAWDEVAQDEVVINVPQFVLSPQHFDQLVFRGRGVMEVSDGRIVRSETATVRRQMEVALTKEIDELASDCFLTEAQKKKIQLAGRGDIVRFFDHVVDLRRKYTTAAMDEKQYSEAVLEMQRLSYVSQFITTDENSLFRKSLRKTLSVEQLDRYQVIERRRQVTFIELALKNLDRVTDGAKLTAETRQEFIDTLITHGHIPKTPNPYGPTIVLLEASRLQDRLKPLLNEAQWRTFQAQVSLAHRSEPTLRKSGIWPVPSLVPEEMKLGVGNE